MTTKEKLAKLFETREKDGRDPCICFTSEALNPESDLYPVYEAVSKSMHDSGLSFHFSYEIARRAVDILVDAENWEDDDAQDQVQEMIACEVPMYNSDLMKIYASDWELADEARSEYGNELNAIEAAQYGYVIAIRNMVQAILANLKKI